MTPDVDGDEEMEDPSDKNQDISMFDTKLLGLLNPNNNSKRVSYLSACGGGSSTKSWRADVRRDKAISTAKAVRLWARARLWQSQFLKVYNSIL